MGCVTTICERPHFVEILLTPLRRESNHGIGDETCPFDDLGGFQKTGGRRREASWRRDGGPNTGSGASDIPRPLSSPGFAIRYVDSARCQVVHPGVSKP